MNIGSNETCDVVIVGSGPSGAITARRLAEAGMSVVCLEQGEYPDYTSIYSAAIRMRRGRQSG